MAAALWQGATLVTVPRFDLEQFLTILQDYRVTAAVVVPPIMLALAKPPLVDRFELSALRFLGSGAAPLDAELEEACAKRLGCLTAKGYGLTETSPVLTTQLAEEARIRHGSAGQFVPNTEAKVVDPATVTSTRPSQSRVALACSRAVVMGVTRFQRPRAGSYRSAPRSQPVAHNIADDAQR